MILRAP
nr:TPA_asm: m87.5 uORF RNA 1 [Murid betaherpesvirus 1]DBA08033.1 TPA_asm: m87.5 uORF RNA 1 [Murid betaherpesvirus 1]